MANNKWSQKGITFKILTLEDFDQVKSFMEEASWPDEPISRSTNYLGGSGFIDVAVNNVILKMIVRNCLENGTSLAAFNEKGDMIGARLGETFDQSYVDDATTLRWIVKYLPSWLMPQKLMILSKLDEFFDIIRYGKNYAIEDFPLHTKFYHGHSVSVSPKARGLGIGKELIQQTMALARDKGCTLVYILATSIYSQRIFANLKFDILNEFEYDEFKDENGKIFFKDMREHTTAQLVAFDLSTFSVSNE